MKENKISRLITIYMTSWFFFVEKLCIVVYHLFKIYVFTLRSSINPYVSLIIYFIFKILLIFAVEIISELCGLKLK